MKISPKRSPKVIFEENLTEKGVSRKAGGAKQQEQTVPREANPGKPTEIWHGRPVPLTPRGHGNPVPYDMTVPLPCAAAVPLW